MFLLLGLGEHTTLLLNGLGRRNLTIKLRRAQNSVLSRRSNIWHADLLLDFLLLMLHNDALESLDLLIVRWNI